MASLAFCVALFGNPLGLPGPAPSGKFDKLSPDIKTDFD